MIIIVLAIVALFAYMGLPTYAKVIVFIINIFIPDPIPYIDEVIMVVGLLNSND